MAEIPAGFHDLFNKKAFADTVPEVVAQAQQLIEEAKLLEQAGAGMIVLEAIPAALAREVTRQITVPTIGIGAGVDCSGQVLVLYDMLDVYPGRKAKFVKNYMRAASSIQGAVELYVKEVKAKTFPGPEHCFKSEG